MIETERLILRRWKDSDLDAFAAINQDPKVMATIGSLKSREETRQMMERFKDRFIEKGFCLYAAELKETAEMIGFIGCSVPGFDAPFMPCVEIGWRLASAHWGKGLAPEGAQAVLADMFARPDIEEIVSFTAAINTNSMRVMKKLGMHTDSADNFDHPNVAIDNPLRPHVLYRLKKPEFIMSS